jgi:hypothetical protein
MRQELLITTGHLAGMVKYSRTQSRMIEFSRIPGRNG